MNDIHRPLNGDSRTGSRPAASNLLGRDRGARPAQLPRVAAQGSPGARRASGLLLRRRCRPFRTSRDGRGFAPGQRATSPPGTGRKRGAGRRRESRTRPPSRPAAHSRNDSHPAEVVALAVHPSAIPATARRGEAARREAMPRAARPRRRARRCRTPQSQTSAASRRPRHHLGNIRDSPPRAPLRGGTLAHEVDLARRDHDVTPASGEQLRRATAVVAGGRGRGPPPRRTAGPAGRDRDCARCDPATIRSTRPPKGSASRPRLRRVTLWPAARSRKPRSRPTNCGSRC